MPKVSMPDGTEVDMPENLSPEMGARLRSYISSQHANLSEKFAKGEAHTEIPDSQPQPKPVAEAPNDPVNFTTGNINKGIAGGVGAPVDLAQDALNLGKAGVGAVTAAMGRPDLSPEIKNNAIGGSKWIESLMKQHGMISDAATPTSPAGKAASQLLQMGGNALGATASTTLAGKVATKLESAVRNAIDPEPPKGIIKGEEPISKTIRESRKAGYVFPPTQVKPTTTNKVLEGIGGKVKTYQDASLRNDQVTNGLAKEALGVSKNTPLSQDTIELVRDEANAVYNKVRAIDKPFPLDSKYVRDVGSLNGEFAALEKKFPGLTKSPEVEELKKILVNPAALEQGLMPTEAIDLSRLLRSKATANYRAANSAGGKPESLAIAQAQRDAANIVEDLISKNLGKSSLYKDWVDARKKLAISHDVESALNPATGTVSPQIIAGLARKGRPLSGPLEKIANFARAFPHASQTPEKIGGVPQSVMDTLFTLAGVGAGGAAHGVEGSVAGAVAGQAARPMTRGMMLSDWYQNRLAGK